VTAHAHAAAPAYYPDTDWSSPGETAGKPDRWQWRTFCGLFITAGSNGRKTDGSYIRPDHETPWTVYEWRLAEGEGQDYKPDRWELVADGVSSNQHNARCLAEAHAKSHRSKP
jgi:hypothetical protein